MPEIMILDEEQKKFLNDIGNDLKFENIEPLVLFCAEVVRTLYELNKSGKKFYCGVPGKPESYEEITFEFVPEKS